jgi:cytochrome c556
MRKLAFAAATAIGLTVAAGAAAQHHHGGHDMGASAPDSRELVNLPPEVREHQLKTMREHFQALSDILAAMGAADYEKAAGIAQVQLGADSLSAAGCKDAANPADTSTPSMHQMLAHFMPEGMSKLGMTMHRAADEFAAAATASAKSGDGKPAYTALARVTAGCIGCHEAYRTR